MAHHEEAIHLDPQQVTLPQTGLWPKLPMIGGVLAVVGLGLSFLLGGGDSHHLAGAYLTAFVYWWTLAMGGLFFTVLHYLARSGWSVVVRRLAENVATTLPVFLLLFLPIFFLWMHDLYHWTHEELLVEGHRGQIVLSSRPGQTRFEVILPGAPPPG